MAKELIGKDVQGVADYSLPFPVGAVWFQLTQNVEETVTTPPNFNRAFFSFSVGSNVFVSIGSNAMSLPPPASPTTTTIELNPSCRQISIEGGQTLRFISDSNAYVNIRYDLGQ